MFMLNFVFSLQKTYQKYRKSLQVTGQGVKDSDDDENWEENKIGASTPFGYLFIYN
jgi:hypothetical protein